MNNLSSDDGGFIAKSTAKEYTQNYRDQGGQGMTHSHFFGKTKLLELLNQNNTIGIRIYYGVSFDNNQNQKPELLIVGVNNMEEDILNSGKILDFSRTCPPYCPPEGSESL